MVAAFEIIKRTESGLYVYLVLLGKLVNTFSHLWFLPFIFFCAGYYFVSLFGNGDPIELPSVIGYGLQGALKELSGRKLTAVIKGEKEDAHLIEGTIISQSPLPGQKVKHQQSVFLVVAKKPQAVPAPSCAGLQQQEIQAQAKTLGVRLKIFYLESHHPKDMCIAQIPSPGTPLHEKIMYIYLSSGITPLRMMPDFRGRSVGEVRDFLAVHSFELKFFSHEQPADQDIINDQRPLPGSIINFLKGTSFYVSARSPNSTLNNADNVYAQKSSKEAPDRSKSKMPHE